MTDRDRIASAAEDLARRLREFQPKLYGVLPPQWQNLPGQVSAWGRMLEGLAGDLRKKD